MTDYIKAYGDSQDKYVKDTYAKMLEFKNQLGTALINSQAQLEQFKIQSALDDAKRT
jgi:intein-encoded DNA endonuclease-like protein